MENTINGVEDIIKTTGKNAIALYGLDMAGAFGYINNDNNKISKTLKLSFLLYLSQILVKTVDGKKIPYVSAGYIIDETLFNAIGITITDMLGFSNYIGGINTNLNSGLDVAIKNAIILTLVEYLGENIIKSSENLHILKHLSSYLGIN